MYTNIKPTYCDTSFYRQCINREQDGQKACSARLPSHWVGYEDHWEFPTKRG